MQDNQETPKVIINWKLAIPIAIGALIGLIVVLFLFRGLF